MSDVITYWLSVIGSFVSSLFQLEIVEGVSYGWLCVACIVLDIVIMFVFRNLVGSVK